MRNFYLLGYLMIFFLFKGGMDALGQSSPPEEKKITMKGRKSSLQDVFDSIQEQTGRIFYYNNNDINVNQLITVRLIDISVNKALDKIFSGSDIRWRYEGDSAVIVTRLKSGKPPADAGSLSQKKEPEPPLKLFGQVVDMKEHAIIGATVTLKGLKIGTVTDLDGDFSFYNVPRNATLLISCIGYQTREIKLFSAQTSLRVVLNSVPNEITMQEVISTGYQRLPKERVTGAISLVDNKKFNEQPGTDVFTRLQYMTPAFSMMPANLKLPGTGMMVRGLSTYSASREPLIILDDFPYNGTLENINPNDVESITILKDAAATSIWGARAGNGVIVITTKKGRYKQPVSVVFNTNFMIAEKPDLFQVKTMSASDLIDVEQKLFDEGYYDDKIAHPAFTSLTPAGIILANLRKGLINTTEATAQLDKLRKNDVRNDFSKYFYRNAINQQYAISIGGGGEKYAWSISGGFDNNRDELGAKYKRYNMRGSNSYKVTEKLEILTSISFIQSDSKSGAPAFGSFRGDQMPVYTTFKDENGDPLPMYTFGKHQAVFIDTLGRGKLLDWRYYPLEEYKHSINKTTIQELIAEAGLKYALTKELSFSAKYRYYSQRTENELYQDKHSYEARNIVNSFTQIDYSNNSLKYIVPPGGIRDLKGNTRTGHDLKGQIDLNKGFGRHYIAAVAGAQISELMTIERASRDYGYNEDLYSSINVDVVNKYPDLITGEDEMIPNPSPSDKTNIRFVSAYLNAAYTFYNKYSISVSGRKDAANIFGIKTNDKWNPLWSGGVSWFVSGEPFYKIGLLPYLRLRFTYGQSGNIDLKKTGVATTKYEGLSPTLNVPYTRIDNSYDPQLRWEKVNMWNMGIDFSMNERISGNIDVFGKKMKDLFADVPVDMTTGLGRKLVNRNVGEMTGKGMDVELNSINSKGKVKWNTNLVLNFYTDKVNRIKDRESLKHSSIVGGGAIGLDGYPAFSYFAYGYGGLDPATGDPQGYVNGVLSKDYPLILGAGTKLEDLVYVGRMIPSFSGSLGNSIGWKGFSLTARVTWKLGYYFRRESINYYNLNYFLEGHPDYAGRWKQPGDELTTNVPSDKFSDTEDRDRFYTYSDVLAVKGDHVRLQYINLGYEIDRSQNSLSSFKKIQLYLFLNNVGLIWKANRENIDPDYPFVKSLTSATVGARIFF